MTCARVPGSLDFALLLSSGQGDKVGVSLPRPEQADQLLSQLDVMRLNGVGLDRVCGLLATLRQFCGAFAEITVDAAAIRWLTKMLESLPDRGANRS
jgi:hypothetical protein